MLRRKIAFLCKPFLENFLSEVTKHFERNHDIRKCYSLEEKEIVEAIKWADIVWLEWANELAIYVTNHPNILEGKYVILRCFSYEGLTGLMEQVNWKRVNDLILVGEHTKEFFKDKYKKGTPENIHVIPDGVNVDKFKFVDKRKGFNLAFLAHLSHKKGIMLLLQAFAKLVDVNDRYKLFIGGDWQEERYKLYFEHIIKELNLEKNIQFDGWIDNPQQWFEDKNYIVCCSPFEGQAMGVMEAMACGTKPLVHNFPGANTIFPNLFIWTTIDAFVHLVLEDIYSSSFYRMYIKDNYSCYKMLKSIDKLIDDIPIKSDHKTKQIKKENIKISACMMMRNESKNLDRCLKSIVNYVDEIVIVDTGSTDNSIEIARKYDAIIYQHQWMYNFSLHRNQSISYATGDWLLIIDCDEEAIWKASPKDFRNILVNADPDITAMYVHFQDIQKGEIVMSYNSAKIYRAGHIEYKGIVHNRPHVNQGLHVFLNALTIKHYGYDIPDEEMLKKHERTKLLLLTRLQMNPEDWEVYFYLSQISGANKELDLSIEYAEKYLEHKNELSIFNPSIYYPLIQALIAKKDFVNAEKWLREANKELPEDLDIAMAHIQYAIETKKGEMVLRAALLFTEIYKKMEVNPAIAGGRFIYNFNKKSLCFCLYHLSVNFIGKGMEYLNSFQKILATLSDSFKEEMTKLAEKDLQQIGVNILKN